MYRKNELTKDKILQTLQITAMHDQIATMEDFVTAYFCVIQLCIINSENLTYTPWTAISNVGLYKGLSKNGFPGAFGHCRV